MAFATAKDQARAHIMRRLMNRVFVPGERISELKLSRELGLSRAPVREALREVASLGLVQIVPGFGAYVHMPGRDELADIFACREACEMKAAQLAACNMASGALGILRDSLNVLAQLLRRVEAEGLDELDIAGAETLLECDLAFHRTIIQASKNAMLARMLTQMHLVQRTWAQRLDPLRFPLVKSLRATHREHEAVLNAMVAKDARGAAGAMSRHVRRSGRRFLRQYGDEHFVPLPQPPRVARMLMRLDFENEGRV